MTNPSPNPAWRLEAPEVYIAETGTAKGRGVFARRAFAADELVEECPVIPITAQFHSFPRELQRIVFNWGVLARTTDGDAIVLGYGSMYNHDNPANMRYEADAKSLTMKFIAVRPIQAGEELTINYNAFGGGPTWDSNHWFERMNVQPLPKG